MTMLASAYTCDALCYYQHGLWRHMLGYRLLLPVLGLSKVRRLVTRYHCPRDDLLFFLLSQMRGKRRSCLPVEDVGGVDVDLVVSNGEPGTIRAELNESTRPSVVPNLHGYFWSVEKFL